MLQVQHIFTIMAPNLQPIWCSCLSMLNQYETIPPLANSDHLGISIDLSIKPIKTAKSQGRLIWHYAFTDWTKTRKLIDNYSWDSILSEDIETVWKLWYHQFMEIMLESIPNGIIRTRKNLPWFDKSTVKLMKRRNLLFERTKMSGDYHQYRLACNCTLAQLQLAKKKYLRQLNPRDPKKFWKNQFLHSPWMK